MSAFFLIFDQVYKCNLKHLPKINPFVLKPAFMTITSTANEPPADIEFGKLWTLDDTFSHPDFRLLYVPPKDEHGKMMIITPSEHEPSYVPDRRFYALSHLWGTDPKDNLWEVSDFISDENGVTVEPIPMRKEKRKTLLKLLRDNPGYWWIDILCCRTDTPPVIMRGVYGCCHTCFAMIDCPSKAIEYFSFVFPQLDAHQRDKIITYYALKGWTLPPLPDRISIVREGCKHARAIWKCLWVSRVWTMQELALPSSVILLSETCDMPFYISADSLKSLLFNFACIFEAELSEMTGGVPESVLYLEDQLSILRHTVHRFHDGFEETSKFHRFKNLDWILTQFAESGRSCYYTQDYVYGVLGILGWDIPRLDSMEDLWDRFLFGLRRVAEKAFSESFYSRLSDDETNSRWPHRRNYKHWQKTIQLHIPEEARSCPLSGACEMQDVYEYLLYIHVDCSCPDCNYFIEYWSLDDFTYFDLTTVGCSES